jgi:hypothetical protein
VTSDNSHYSIVKDLLLPLSTKCRNFNVQNGSLRRYFNQARCLPSPGLCRSPYLEGSSFDYLRSKISNLRSPEPGGGEGIRTPDPRVANAVLCQLSYTPDKNSNFEIRISKFRGWLRGRDLNPRPLGYEPNELPDCSTPRQSQHPKPDTPTNTIGDFKSEIENPTFTGGPG